MKNAFAHLHICTNAHKVADPRADFLAPDSGEVFMWTGFLAPDFGKDFTGENMIYAKTLSELNDPFEVKGGGLGISLVNVNVFRKMPYPYFKYVIYDNDTILSEDLYFCSEARKYGMNIKCNPNVKGNHIYEVSV